MTSKTIELRKVIKNLLLEINENIFYENASDTAPYPYIVYELSSVEFGNIGRDDLILEINIWDKNKSSKTIEIIADNIEKKLNFLNIPNEFILPTFYIISRNSIQDEDKSIRRRQLKFSIQNYYIGG